MIILDTNVVSEPMKPFGDPAIMDWIDRQDGLDLYFTTISLAEMLRGVAILPHGRRRARLAQGVARVENEMFPGRILSFDAMAAHAYGLVCGRAREKGKALIGADAQIAAIAEAHGFAVATRDTTPFLAAGVDVIDPWKP